MKNTNDLEAGVELARQHGIATGHIDTWPELLSEVLEQHEKCRQKLIRLNELEQKAGMPLETFVGAKF